ncbi:MAG: hypothetical protein ACI89X_003341 [Planctomycetota bacterium]
MPQNIFMVPRDRLTRTIESMPTARNWALVHKSERRSPKLPISGVPDPQRSMPSTKSRVHPKYKTKYRVGNWSDYDRPLVERGNLTIWLSPDAIAQWNAKPTRRREGQPKHSDLAIEAALTLRLLFQLPLRQVEGFLRSLFDLMGSDYSGHGLADFGFVHQRR